MKKDKNKRILELAKADGDDADLILLENIEELEEQVESLTESLNEGLSKITDSSDTHYEIVNKMTKNILNDIKGEKGDVGEKGDKGDKGDTGRDGVDGKDGRDGRDGRDGLDGKDADVDIEEISTMVLADVMSQLPEAIEITPEEIIDKLESREDDDRLDAKAIKGIKNYDDEIATLQNRTQLLVQLTSGSSSGGSGTGGGGHTIQDEGSSLTQRTKLNFVGAGVTVTDDAGNDATKVTISGGGAGTTTVETPTGTVNSTNTAFTVTNEPLWVVSDGITYFDGAGYTYAALSITMDIPPSQYIRSIY